MSGCSLLILVILSNILVSGSFLPIVNVLVALFHELGHLLIMYLCGIPLSGVRFVGFGFQIRQKSVLSYRQNLLVALGGPVFNILFGGILILLSYWLKAQVIAMLILSNFLYAVLNLLPIPPLDGHKILHEVLFSALEYRQARIAEKSIQGVFSTLLVSCLVLLLTFKIFNISLIVVVLLLLFSLIMSFFS